MRRIRSSYRAGLMLAAFLSITATSSAQTATGQITGTVKDTTGAVMAKVKVVVTNQQTGLTRETSTDEQRRLRGAAAPGGRYVVTAEQAGFKLAVHSDVPLNVDQVQRVDMQLDAGNVTETVEVRSAAVALDTASASIGHNITATQVTELPLNGRNFLQLLFLGAGAVETTRRAGRHAAGRRQRDQHHGLAADVEQLHARRHVEHRHRARHAGRDPVGRCDPGVQGADDHLLGGVRLQREPDQHRQQDRHEPAQRAGVRLLPQRRARRAKLLRQPEPRSPSSIRSSSGSSSAVRCCCPCYNGRNKTFFLVNYEGTRIEGGSQDFYTVPTPGRARRPVQRRRSSIRVTGQPFPNNTIPQVRFSRVAQLALSNSWCPAPNATAAAGQLHPVRTLPQTPTSSRCAAISSSARLGPVFGRYTQVDWTEHARLGTCHGARRRVFVQDTTNWQVSHTLPIQQQSRQSDSASGFVDARANQHGHRLPARRRRLPAADGRLHRTTIRDYPAGVPEHRHDRARRRGQRRATTTGEQPADVGYEQHHDVDPRPPHAELRRQLSPMVAAARPGQRFLGSSPSTRLHRQRRVADMLLGYYSASSVFQPAGFSVPGAPGNPREFNFKYFAPYVQDDWKVNSRLTLNLGPALGLSQRALRDAGSHGLARSRHPRGGLLVADQTLVDGGIADGSYYKFAGRRNPENAIGSRCLRRASDSRSAVRRERPSSAAATACSGTRSRGAKSTAPPTSIRTSAAATTSRRSVRRRRCRRPNDSSRALPRLASRHPRPTRSSR